MIVSQESVSLWWKNLVSENAKMRKEPPLFNIQEEVVKSQCALHVAHFFGSTLAKIFWLEALWHHSARHSYSYASVFGGAGTWCVSSSMENTRCDVFYL